MHTPFCEIDIFIRDRKFYLASLEVICCNFSFLAKRGVREDIATFDARNIPKEIRESVEELLHKNKGSFDSKVIANSYATNSHSVLYNILLVKRW